MSLSKIASTPGFKLPYGVVKVRKNENGEREIEGVKAFVDSFPEIPFTKRDVRGNVIALSRGEREHMALVLQAKAKRAKVKAEKAESFEKLGVIERARIEAKKADEKSLRDSKKAAIAALRLPPPAKIQRQVFKPKVIIGAGENWKNEIQPLTDTADFHDKKWGNVGE